MQLDEFDPGLFGLWGCDGYCGAGQRSQALDLEPDPSMMAGAVQDLMLEIKSVEMVESGVDLRAVLNNVTKELTAQLAIFTQLRVEAQKALNDPDGDQKQARADLKASNDAIALTVRTLEKTDDMQRKISDAREAEAERTIDEAGLEACHQQLLAHIEARAAERAEALVAGRQTEVIAAGVEEPPG